MRRREAGRGAAPAGRFGKAGTRAASGLRPGPLRGPARSWLTTVWPKTLGSKTLGSQTRPVRRLICGLGRRGTDGESAAR